MVQRAVLWIDVFSFVVLWILAFRYGPHTWMWICGLSLGAVCLVPWIVARLQLGDSFTLRAEAHRLITTGIYSRIRHPIYVFGSLAFLGALLALQIWYLLIACFVLSVAVETVRARREDRILEERFGEAFKEYRKRTWF